MTASRRNAIFACIGSLLLTVGVGCGGGTAAPEEGPDSNATGQAASANASGLAAYRATPQATITKFLESLKSGDQAAATRLLTETAKSEMAKSNAAIQPPGSPTATFQVTEVEFLGEQQQGAHVASRWLDTDEQGQPTEHEIVWMLRKESVGWAVAGFATVVFEGQQPLILNFEDPQELQRKREAVDAELARREDQTTRQ